MGRGAAAPPGRPGTRHSRRRSRRRRRPHRARPRAGPARPSRRASAIASRAAAAYSAFLAGSESDSPKPHPHAASAISIPRRSSLSPSSSIGEAEVAVRQRLLAGRQLAHQARPPRRYGQEQPAQARDGPAVGWMLRASDAQVDRLARRSPGSIAVVLPEQQACIRLHAPRALDRALGQLEAGVQPLPCAIDREQPPGLLGRVEEELHRARPDLLPPIGLDVPPWHGPLCRRVMVRQQLDHLEPPLAGRLLDPPCRLQVRHGPVALRDALVGDVPDERVLEDVFRLPGHRRAEARQHEVT